MSAASAPLSPGGERSDGYLPIGAYAAIDDWHSVALVGRDGSVDWLCLPRFDGPFVFGALVDADRGGRFSLAPVDPHEVSRRYLPGTNVLETAMRTAHGSVTVTDAMTIQPDASRTRELARRIEGVDGIVTLTWRVQPRFAHVERPAIIDRAPLLALRAASIDGDPAPFAAHDELEQRIDETIDWWRQWCGARTYDGPWRDAVLRGGLVLKMLLDADSGAMVAAPTTGLPEAVGASRNWDYRFCWLRDSSFAVDALMRLGDDEAAERFLQWVMQASAEHHPRLHPFYRLHWIALDRALKLADQGKISGEHAERWRTSRGHIHAFIERRCWSPGLNAYARSADVDDELDAGVLVGVFMDYEPSDRARLHATVDRLREHLGTGPLIYRYTGMAAVEGTFLACAFWVVHALARLDRMEEARTLMEQLIPLANDVGLYSEEKTPDGEMLGNFPQALTHLALINAASVVGEQTTR